MRAAGGAPSGRAHLVAEGQQLDLPPVDEHMGLAEPADTRGHEWLAERVTEVPLIPREVLFGNPTRQGADRFC